MSEEKANTVTRFRSTYPNYVFDTLQFSNNVATTSDAGLVAKAKKDPHFGEGKDFWIDHVPVAAAEGAKPEDGGEKPATKPAGGNGAKK